MNETQVNDDPAVHTAETAANRQAMVENAGESVESSTETAADGAEPLSQRISADSRNPLALGSAENTGLTAQNGADRQAVMQSVPVEESTLDGMDSSSPMRETYGMEAPRTEGQKQARTEQVLRSWGVSKTAAQEIGQKLPEETNVERYAAAASTLYRLGQMEDVKTFDQALELAGTGSGMAANVNYVLGNLKGRNALEIAYNYGKGEAESRWEKSRLGGTLTEQSLTGRGETIYKGTLRNANDAGSQVIELNAAATGTTAVLKKRAAERCGTGRQPGAGLCGHGDGPDLLWGQCTGYVRHGAARGLPLVQRTGQRGSKDFAGPCPAVSGQEQRL